MRYITERELRDLFCGGVPSRYDLPPGCALTPAARQYLTELRLFDSEWDQRPRQQAAQTARPKPEHMTHLNARELVSKEHPRIVLRGKLDSLESEILVLMTTCREDFRPCLGDALALTRRILAADVKEAPLPPWRLDGMEPEEIHRQSHHPEQFGFQGHILPAPEQGLLAAQLNRLRTLTRETELAAVAAYRRADGVRHEDCVLALNRLSSYFYVLQLRAARG